MDEEQAQAPDHVRHTATPSKGDVAADVARAIQLAIDTGGKATGFTTYANTVEVGSNDVIVTTHKGRKVQILVRFPKS